MALEKLNLSELVCMVQIFRVDQYRWPRTAAELMAFSLAWGKPLDASPFHTLIFSGENTWSIGLEYVLSKQGEEMGFCGRLELSRIGQTDQEMTFAWQTRHLPLPSKPIKKSVYCWVDRKG